MNQPLTLSQLAEMDPGQKATALHKCLELVSVNITKNRSWLLDRIPFLPEGFKRFISRFLFPARTTAISETLLFNRSVLMLMKMMSLEEWPPHQADQGLFEQLHEEWLQSLGEELDLSSPATTSES